MARVTTVTSPQRPGKAQGVFRLVILYPPKSARGEHSKVLEQTLLLSREAGQMHNAKEPERLALSDQEVSRRHALVTAVCAESKRTKTRWQLSDQMSHNGTFVNGERIEQVQLSSGDLIRVGQHLLLLQYLDHAASQRVARRRLANSPLVGDGPACKWIDEQITACAEQNAPVLILGESGTGKELVAQHLHRLSGRKGPLVPVNCTALTETLADSELFGHLKGAFSGALHARAGLFSEAQGGTLMLDELGDMPLSIQAKLLRTIETGEVRRVGSNRATTVDARVVATTNVDLETAVAEGRFRGDLWARLQRQVIRLPPLRERRDDVLLLARHFLRIARSRQSISADAAEALVLHDWPYNVRELRNAIEAAARQACGSRTIDLEHLPAEIANRLTSRLGKPARLPLARSPIDAAELREILQQNSWNVAKVATLLGKDRKQIYRWCDNFGIEIKRRR